MREESLKKPQTKKTTQAIQLTIQLTNDYMSAGLVLWDSNVLGRERERDGLSQQVTADAGGKLTTILCRQLLPRRKPGLAYKGLRQPLIASRATQRITTLLRVYKDKYCSTLLFQIK